MRYLFALAIMILVLLASMAMEVRPAKAAEGQKTLIVPPKPYRVVPMRGIFCLTEQAIEIAIKLKSAGNSEAQAATGANLSLLRQDCDSGVLRTWMPILHDRRETDNHTLVILRVSTQIGRRFFIIDRLGLKV